MSSYKLIRYSGNLRNLPAAVAISLSLLAQQPESPDNAVFRINSTLVQIDAVVTDAKGNQVSNLTANDFEVYADGVPQRITHFSYVAISAPHITATESVKNPILAPPPMLLSAAKTSDAQPSSWLTISTSLLTAWRPFTTRF